VGVLDLFRLDGCTALVTGAAKGIGAAIATALGEAGADVACLDMLSCSETESKILAAGRRAFQIHCDLQTASLSELRAVVRQVVDHWGRLDILVNNAGITRPNPVLSISEQDFEAEVGVNQRALFFLSQEVACQMVKHGGGKIINIASVNAFNGGLRVASYAGTKGAVAGFTRAFAVELAEKGVRVNAIAPGFTETDNIRNLTSDPVVYEDIRSQIPARRWGKPQDYQGAAVFLASRAADYLDGSILVIDGGWLIR